MTLLKVLASILVVAVAGAFIWLDLSGDGTVDVSLLPPGGGAEARLPPAGPVIADPGLLEPSPTGRLPKVGEDGRKPWRVYRAQYKTEDAQAPRIAIVIVDLGLKSAPTRAAIATLPPVVTLAFSPYAKDLPALVRTARVRGHEVLLAVPMEPPGYPGNDPGAQTLLTSNTIDRNIWLLRWSMGRFPGYVGIVAHEGGRFLGSREHLRPVLKEVQSRGLMFLDPSKEGAGEAFALTTEMKLPAATVTGVIDEDPSPASIKARLETIAKTAKARGYAVALGRPYPATIAAVKAWLPTFKAQGLAATPITGVAEIISKSKK